MRFKSNSIIICVILCVCILCSGCSGKLIGLRISSNSTVATTLDDVSIKRIKKNEVYMSQHITEKIRNAKLVSEYDSDTLIDDMDSVLFGKCCQEDEYGKDYIDWIVLDRDEEKALILSKYILNNISYSINDNETTWDISNIRKWLNDDFYVNAFSEEEKNIILKDKVYNTPNDRWEINGGTDTMDNVFLLSDDEVIKYFYKDDMCSENKKLATYPTNYAKNVDNHLNKLWITNNKDKWFDGYCSYYLRTPGVSKMEVSVVNQYGYLNTFGAKCCSYNYGIRPALWVRIDGIKK